MNKQCKMTIEESYQFSENLLWNSSQAYLGGESIILPEDYDTILDAQISYIGATFLLSNSSGGVSIFSMDLHHHVHDHSFSGGEFFRLN